MFSANFYNRNNIIITNNTPEVKITTKFNNQGIVYRGITNPILIEIDNNLNYSASGEGLEKVDNLGNYKLYPRTGKEMVITVTGNDKNGNPFEIKKTLKIKDISVGISQFNGKGCKKCELRVSKKELTTGRVSHAFPDLLIDGLKIEVVSFKIKIPGKPTKQVKGNRIKSSLLITDILKAKRGSLIQIFDVQIRYNIPYNSSSMRICKIAPIQIRLIG